VVTPEPEFFFISGMLYGSRENHCCGYLFPKEKPNDKFFVLFCLVLLSANSSINNLTPLLFAHTSLRAILFVCLLACLFVS
jgi:hypothetical protein